MHKEHALTTYTFCFNIPFDRFIYDSAVRQQSGGFCSIGIEGTNEV